MSDLDEFKATYFDECSELLSELEEIFALIEVGDRDSARINAAFRAVHSIKGGAGAFGFGALVAFAHGYESLMDQVRDGRVLLSDDVVALCIRANDLLADFVGAARSGTSLADEHGMAEKLQARRVGGGAGTGR
ncbi:Hpt domain-containing protein [Devosia algicola]|uniref:Hpt domain-containing protein n=1 Tax=Devosia algicola TaxID=3026418 RepID=A0ABY7YK89_9HYPH|nr:Hpt domain-containing protein [Devosia algicola]WDR01494.1 Hpt domain-containing protein [Devosia algicola]